MSGKHFCHVRCVLQCTYEVLDARRGGACDCTFHMLQPVMLGVLLKVRNTDLNSLTEILFIIMISI